MSDKVTLTIDGVSVTVPKGTLIVEAGKQINNEIPVFLLPRQNGSGGDVPHVFGRSRPTGHRPGDR